MTILKPIIIQISILDARQKTMYTKKKMKRRLGWIIVRKSPRIGRHAFLSGLFRRGIHYS